MRHSICISVLLCSFIIISLQTVWIAGAYDRKRVETEHILLGPFDISSTIKEVRWYPEKEKLFRGGGSFYPAHFIVKLIKFSGVSAEEAVAITNLLSEKAYGEKKISGVPPFINIKVPSNDRNYLKSGMKIHIKGYEIHKYNSKTIGKNKGITIQ